MSEIGCPRKPEWYRELDTNLPVPVSQNVDLDWIGISTKKSHDGGNKITKKLTDYVRLRHGCMQWQ